MTILLVGLALLVVAGIAAAVLRRTRAAARLHQLLVAAACGLGGVAAARVLLTGEPESLTFSSTLPGGALVLGIDPLSAVFLLAALGVGGACAIFGAHDLGRSQRHGRGTELAFALLVAAISLVVVARSVIVFLGAWEVMAISSYVLIVTDHEEPEVRRAGLIYLVATHTATLALFAMFATWAQSAGDWTFAALAAASPALGPPAVTAILLLALFGFGFKAGCVPLHFWLPPAHAAAPSHVSALMSGVVIKTGIYGLFRVLAMLGGAPAWWGWLLFGIGVTSAVFGVLWALAQHDFKRLLAYHSVENIGIILMGMGIGVLGVAQDAPAVAMLGFAGALLHTVNHALFKSLLFLGAGAVYHATGTRNMEELGGLGRRMPLTWLGFAIGAAAIIGVPPFNGFVSEWLVYQGMFEGADARRALRLALLGIPALALTGALALACFAKVSGVMFLGSPRTERAAAAVESDASMVGPIVALAAVCVLLGVLPALGISLVTSSARTLTGAGAALPASTLSGASMLSLVAVGAIALVAVLWLMRRSLGRSGLVRHETTWACGYDAVTPRMQYTASSFAAPLLSVFGRMSGLREERSHRAYRTHPMDLVLDMIALPAWTLMRQAALRVRATQHGRLHLYLLYVMAALVAMLAYLSVAPW